MASSAMFFLAGRALPEALGAIEDWRSWQLMVSTVAGLVTLLLVVHFAFSLLATGMDPIAAALTGRNEGKMRAKAAG